MSFEITISIREERRKPKIHNVSQKVMSALLKTFSISHLLAQSHTSILKFNLGMFDTFHVTSFQSLISKVHNPLRKVSSASGDVHASIYKIVYVENIVYGTQKVLVSQPDLTIDSYDPNK